MKNFFPTFFVFGAICALLSNFAYSEETSVEPSASVINLQQKALDSLLSDDLDERAIATAELNDHRNKLINRLLQILYSNISMEKKAAVAVTLGRYQADAAVPFLVDNLEWEVKNAKKMNAGITYSTSISEKEEILGWPMSFPLVNIGTPAVEPVLKKLTQTDDPEVGRLCLWICQMIEGPDVTQFRLQGLLDKETDQTKKGRIQSALNALKNLDAGK